MAVFIAFPLTPSRGEGDSSQEILVILRLGKSFDKSFCKFIS